VHQLFMHALQEALAQGRFSSCSNQSSFFRASLAHLGLSHRTGEAKSVQQKKIEVQIMERFRAMLGGGCIRMITIGSLSHPLLLSEHTRSL
jgi:hypothetical protein